MDAGVVAVVLERPPLVELAGVLSFFKGVAACLVAAVLERPPLVELAGVLSFFKGVAACLAAAVLERPSLSPAVLVKYLLVRHSKSPVL